MTRLVDPISAVNSVFFVTQEECDGWVGVGKPGFCDRYYVGVIMFENNFEMEGQLLVAYASSIQIANFG
jgi:hypothetical protein